MISSDHRVIFPHIPGCAGTSVEQTFLGHDWGNIDPWLKHIGSSYYERAHPAEWKSYFKFSIVRNPWDYVKSMSRFQRKSGCSHPIYTSIESHGMVAFVSSVLGRMPDFRFFLGDGLDKVYKFEEMLDGWADIRQTVLERSGVELSEVMNHVNVGDSGAPERHVSRQEFFAGEQEAIDMIADQHARDIEYWGYQF